MKAPARTYARGLGEEGADVMGPWRPARGGANIPDMSHVATHELRTMTLNASLIAGMAGAAIAIFVAIRSMQPARVRKRF
jgi:hypothetical protein